MMTQHSFTPWEQHAPYSKMLADYEQAADRILNRQIMLKKDLQRLTRRKSGTLDSAQSQTLLERRIALLRAEYADICDTIEDIRAYAAREVQ